jgi:dephospho-CoA kinase
MTEGPGAKDAPPTSTNEQNARGQDALSGLGELERRALLDWVGENLTDVRRSVSGQRLLYQSLGVGFVVGLATHVGGYLLRSSVTTEPLLLVADLLYALGWALWTGVVVVVFAQAVPESKRRQLKGALDAYEAAQRDQAQAGSDQAPGDDGPPTAR